jgi:tellurite resistance protein TehA-like permease
MPISLLVIGIALEKTGDLLLPEPILWNLLQTLWVLGAAGILFFALFILNIFFHKAEIEWETSTLGWLIPPVSALLVPVLGASLSLHFIGTPWGDLNLLGSLVFMGVGGLLFIFVMSVVFARYIFYALPPAHLAPTLWVGIAPTSILTILALKFGKPLALFFNAAPETEQMLTFLARPAGVIFWGFAFFWLMLAFIVTLGIHQKSELPFALSWWAFIFPLGAFTVATGVLYQSIPKAVFQWTGLAVLAIVIVLWLIVTVRTAQGIFRGTIFVPHAPKKTEK